MTRGPRLVGTMVVLLLTVVDAPRPIGLAPALKIRKFVSVNGACPGAEQVTVRAASSVTYCYTVTNTGTGPARDIIVMDAGTRVRVGALARGQSRTVARTVTAPSTSAVASDATATMPPAAEDAADTTAPVFTASGPFSSGVPCAGVEVTLMVGGAAMTACYTVTADALDASDGAAESTTAVPSSRAPALDSAGLIRVGSTPATATTLQSP